MIDMEMREILGDMEKERTPQEFLKWVETSINELDKGFCVQEQLLKFNDSHGEAISKKFYQEILPLALLIKNHPKYLEGTTLQYQKGNQKYDCIVKGHKDIKFIEITAPAYNNVSHNVDKELSNDGYTANVEWGRRSDLSINSIKLALKNKVSKSYGKGYILIILIDNSGLSFPKEKLNFEEEMKKIVWDKGNFLEVFVVGTCESEDKNNKGKWNSFFRKL